MSLPTGGVALPPQPPTPQQLQTAFESGIWYTLALWPALHVAVSNSWGGPSSSDKRDWFAGAVAEFFSTSNTASNATGTGGTSVDAEDLEVFLLQVMQDEFECNVEDDSEVEVARTILRLKQSLMERDMSELRALEGRWANRGSMKHEVKVIDNGPQEEVDDDDEEFEGFSDSDEEMGEASAPAVPATVREKVEPEVDDDGFTKVPMRKKK